MEPNALKACEEAIGHTFKDACLLTNALVHASSTEDRVGSNERLEFLGDAILGAVISEELFRTYPNALEGEMTRIKGAVVSRRTLAKVSDRLGLTNFLIVGKGVSQGGPMPTSVRAGVYESVFAAVYLDGGLEAARAFFLRTLADEVRHTAENRQRRNYKSLLQHYAQRHLNATPAYAVYDEQGPEHSKAFQVAAVVGNRTFPPAWGPSKKAAEQNAARVAYESLTGTAHPEEPKEGEDEPGTADERE